jgi:CASK-interacting protein
MSRGGKPAPQVKRVAPPAVPDAFGGPSPGSAGAQHRLSGTSFGSSQGYASSEDSGFLHPPDTPLAPIRGNSIRQLARIGKLRLSSQLNSFVSHHSDDHSDYGSTVSGASGGSGKSPGAVTGPGGGPQTFTFPPPGPLTHKTAVYYHHQLALQEDQGIDMTQV